MPITDEQIDALRDLGNLGAKVLKLRGKLAQVNDEIQKSQEERVRLQGELQQTRTLMQERWEALRQ